MGKTKSKKKVAKKSPSPILSKVSVAVRRLLPHNKSPSPPANKEMEGSTSEEEQGHEIKLVEGVATKRRGSLEERTMTNALNSTSAGYESTEKLKVKEGGRVTTPEAEDEEGLGLKELLELESPSEKDLAGQEDGGSLVDFWVSLFATLLVLAVAIIGFHLFRELGAM